MVFVFLTDTGAESVKKDVKTRIKAGPALSVENAVAASVGASMLRVGSIQITHTNDCQTDINVAIRNTGQHAFTGQVSWTTKLKNANGWVPTGTYAFTITGLAPNQVHTVKKSLTRNVEADCKQLSLEFYDQTKSQPKLVDTKVIDLTGAFTAEVVSAQISNDNHFVITIRNTSSVPTRFSAHLLTSNTPNSWHANKTASFQCTAPGQSQTVAFSMPEGWPNAIKAIKAVIKSGLADVAETQAVNAPTQ
jgi:hypothetical protein